MKIKLDKQPRKYIARQPLKIRDFIIGAIKRLPVGDVRPLKGLEGAFRLRVGKLRILYRTDAPGSIIVFKIDTRGDVYKK